MRRPAARTRRYTPLRQPYWPREPSGGDVDQHQVHRPAAEPVLRQRPILARDRNLPAIDAAHRRALDCNLLAVEPDPPACPAPAARLALVVPAVARTADRFDVGLHHRAQRFHSGRKAPPLEALLNVCQRVLRSAAAPAPSMRQLSSWRCSAKRIRHPGLPAQAGQRRLLQDFNSDRDIPRMPGAARPLTPFHHLPGGRQTCHQGPSPNARTVPPSELRHAPNVLTPETKLFRKTACHLIQCG